MNRKGQVSILLVCAIAVIIGLVLLQQVATNVEQGTRAVSGTVAVTNETFTTPALDAVKELTGQELVGTPTVVNQTAGSEIISTGNYTIYECVRTSDGLKGICYKTLTEAGAERAYNISYVYYPDGYIDDAGGRSIAGIIVLLAAIGIAVVCLPRVKDLFD